MALADFLRKVTTARNVAYRYLRPLAAGEPLPPRAGAEWERLRAAVPLWLAPEIATDLDPAEVVFLPPDRLADLSNRLANYRKIAEHVGNGPATDDQMNAGLEELGRIVSLLGDAVADAEGLALLSTLLREAGSPPPFVLGFDFTLDTDWSGDPGVWFWVLMSDALDPESRAFLDFADRFSRIGWKVVKTAGSDRLPYVGYRQVADILQPVGEDDA